MPLIPPTPDVLKDDTLVDGHDAAASNQSDDGAYITCAAGNRIVIALPCPHCGSDHRELCGGPLTDSERQQSSPATTPNI